MDTSYLICAGFGGTLLVLQALAGVAGVGGGHEVAHDAGADHDAGTDHDHDHGGSWFLGMLTLRTATAALTFFGLGGLTAGYYEANEISSLGVAVGSALAAFYLVGTLFRSLSRLKADGTARVERAIGQSGSVYLRIPRGRTGQGKVQIALQNRTVEYHAVTAGPELATGSPIRVVGILTADTVEVEAA